MSDFDSDWQAWRDAREGRLRSPVGWLAITGIHWLGEEPQRFADVPGVWRQDEDGTTVELDDGVRRLGRLDERGTTLTLGDTVVEVADRDGRTIVRPRHPDSPNLTAYRGTPCFPPDPAWVVTARVEPDNVLVFEHDGDEHRLVAWDDEDGLWVLFRDATSGVTTYPAMRQLVLDAPAPDGTVTIDFNRAHNMPCAYTDFATCPVPPPENTLPFAVEAGEQTPVPNQPGATVEA
ncbi:MULTISPECIES: DUF1684 domain-containing protein [Nocardioides]|uniref:DUF1684 domain-containing protein n=1 Tax=Nocardioides TaxID=1839 RepID=UPI002867CD95|nr:DUF1684 domain-containing protein [Nocardioides sp. CGMCC 1.13656]